MLPKIYDGTGKAPPERTELRAGALTAVYEAGMLRYIRLVDARGECEILCGIYAAVRDHNWSTIPAQLRDVRIESGLDWFDVTFTSDHQQGDIHFVWQGSIHGSADGVIRFSFDGEALTSFRTNRTGFCVLHPMSLAGAACEIEHIDGSIEPSAFPDSIEPHQPFFEVRALTHEVLPGVRAEVRMTGDTFETEDQRNWTDASYKTYCTPLSRTISQPVTAGDRIRQEVVVRLLGDAQPITMSATELTLTVVSAAHPLPPLGLGCASDGVPLTTHEIERLKVLNLAHLRLDLPLAQLTDGELDSRLRQAAAEASAVGCSLELAVTLTSTLDDDLRRLSAAVDAVQPNIVRWLFYGEGDTPLGAAALQTARQALGGSGTPIGTGTNGYFTQLNRSRPPADSPDWVTYSLNPQVHAFDNASLVETLPTQAVTVASARAFSGAAKIAVSPVTLKMRWNLDATEARTEVKTDVLPVNVDVRQMSLFGAGWTLGSLKALASADSVTYFETTGWSGVMERESGSPLPQQFPSTAGGVYPMYHVFADVGEFAGGDVLNCVSSDPLRFEGLALRKAGALRVLLANLTHEPQRVTIRGISRRFVQKTLDETSATQAVTAPEAFRATPGSEVAVDEAGLQINLLPYALVRLDQQLNDE